MKVSFLDLAISIILISCSNLYTPKEVDYIGYDEKSFYLTGRDSSYELKDRLGLIQMKIPERLDTFYSWNDYSCCSSCGWFKYRFADKKYPQFAESGWYWIVPDSVYQLNIWHRPIKEATDSVTLKPLSEKDTSNCYYHPQIVWASKSDSFLFKKFKLINKRPFIISAFISPRGKGKFANSQPLFVVAETNLKSRELYFVGECRAKDTTGFIDNMYRSFLSIKIEEKQ